MDDVVQRLHRALAEALAQRSPGHEAEPVTVAEIYQELVPYRSVRGAVGFEMNADYEHALLRLLAGEQGLVRLEPADVREQLEQELAAPNPDVTLFRRFATSEVWVSAPPPQEPGSEERNAVAPPEDEGAWTPAWLAEAAERERRQEHRPWMPEPDEEEEMAAGEEELPAAPWESAPAETAGLERELPRAATGRPDSPGGQCVFCGGVLPTDRAVRFCPYCGADQQLRPCARCGEILEPGWRYCISCGAPAPAPGATA